MTSSPGWKRPQQQDCRHQPLRGARGDGDLRVGVVLHAGKVSTFAAIARRSAGTPVIGAYWLWPARIAFVHERDELRVAIEVGEALAQVHCAVLGERRHRP